MPPESAALERPAVVWLIEDNETFRRAALRLVAHLDGVAGTRAFKSGEAALRALPDAVPPDIVLLDLGLPGMGGIEVISRFKAARPEVRIVVLTVFDDLEQVFRAICAGADGYLLKEASFDSLRDGLAEVRRGGAPMNGFIAKQVLRALARNQAVPPDYGLTGREREILECLVRGLSNKESATHLGMSVHTVDFHQRRIYQKLHVNNRTSAVAKALTERLT
jgi:DNA-binding NarL/FixJ family response regulator